MSVFIRRFLSDPGNTILLEIESVNILDLEPPASIAGIGTGTVIMVAELENGPFNTPTEVSGVDDLSRTFGTLGYTYGGVSGQNPSAVARKADGALVAETWNGNGFVQLNGKKFARLILVRPDTSVGAVEFRRQAYLTGASAFRYNLEPAQTLALSVDGGGPLTATFSATAATVTGVAGTFPTLFTGGETLTVGYDGATNSQVTFLAADQSNAQVASRINQYAGFTFVDLSGGQLRFTGLQRGTGGQVRIVSGSAGVIATLGLTVANTAGTGNVVNIDAVTPAEVKTIVEAAVAGTRVETDSLGRLRISNTTTPLTGTLSVSSVTATDLGFTTGQAATAVTGTAGVIPAGTVVQNSGATRVFVTMQDVAVTAAGAGPYTVKVRHALDDGTGLGSGAGTVTVVLNAPDLGSFACINPQIMTAALTESQIDTAYVTAINSTLDLNTVSRVANLIFSARQSNIVRRQIKANALTASESGMFGRMGIVRPPLNTLKATAMSTTSEPGVGAYRDQRVIYCYIGANTFVPMIGARGTAGGTGFTADGNVDIGSDGFMASILSQLPPEENPGQLTNFTGAINGIESGANVQGFTIDDYKLFKAAGIAALRMDDGVAIFQSGVTSVDPLVHPNLKNISRRRMADFIQDSIAKRGKSFGKKLSTNSRRRALTSEIRGFMESLLAINQPGQQRIAGFTIDDKSGNTLQTLGQGLYRIILRVRTLASLDSIVIETTIGEQVEVDEILPLAA